MTASCVFCLIQFAINQKLSRTLRSFLMKSQTNPQCIKIMQQGISCYIHVTIIFLASTADQQGRKITHKKRLMHFYDRLIRHTVRKHLLTITGQKGMCPAWTCQYLFSGVLYHNPFHFTDTLYHGLSTFCSDYWSLVVFQTRHLVL